MIQLPVAFWRPNDHFGLWKVAPRLAVLLDAPQALPVVEIFAGHRALFRPLQAPAVFIGNFDGVHLGHQALIATAKEEAKRLGGETVALTFEPHPSDFLAPASTPKRLTSPSRKLELLDERGVDVAIVEPFDSETAAMSAAEFTDLLLAKVVGAQAVVVGHDFAYGQRRAGNVDLLRKASERLGFALRIVEPVHHRKSRVSSTRIREQLLGGPIRDANALLGRAHDVDGTVVKGAGRGKSIGVPTANLKTSELLLPRAGVYATWVQVLNDSSSKWHPAATNLGRNPTFVQDGAMTLESHLLDVNRDLYGATLRVQFVDMLREEVSFDSPDQLIKQIHRDISRCRTILTQDSSFSTLPTKDTP